MIIFTTYVSVEALSSITIIRRLLRLRLLRLRLLRLEGGELLGEIYAAIILLVARTSSIYVQRNKKGGQPL